MSLGWLVFAPALAADPDPEALASPPPEPANVFDPSKERFLERERRSRGAYGVAAAVGAVGVTLEVIGGLADLPGLYRFGGTMEAVAIPTMAFTSLTSAHALDKLADAPLPVFGYTASAAAAVDLAASLAAAPDATELTQAERRQLAAVALTGRLVTLTAAVLQQRQNNRVRRRVGLRVDRSTPKRRAVVGVSPWLRDKSAGILFSLSARPGGRPTERPRWMSKR